MRDALKAAILCLAASVVPGFASYAQTTAVRTGMKVYTIEAAGGTLGAAAGMGLGLAVTLVRKCPTENDVVCPLQKLAGIGAAGAVGTVFGVWGAGHKANTRPSVFGATLGALAGIGTGVLIHRQLSESGHELRTGMTVAILSLSQGLLSAAGSRLIAAGRPR
jgi:hypothetical protein